MNNDYTDITIILDRSGSMAAILEPTIQGYNTFINEQRKQPGKLLISRVIFDDVIETPELAVPIAQASELNTRNFVPRNGTALFDAIGTTIENVGKRLAAMSEQDRPGKVLIVIITDGQENTSHAYRSGDIKEMINHQRNKYNWQFSYLGANQDAVLAGSSIGIGAQASYTFGHNAGGTKGVFAGLSSSVSTMRACAGPANYSYDATTANAVSGQSDVNVTTGAAGGLGTLSQRSFIPHNVTAQVCPSQLGTCGTATSVGLGGAAIVGGVDFGKGIPLDFVTADTDDVVVTAVADTFLKNATVIDSNGDVTYLTNVPVSTKSFPGFTTTVGSPNTQATTSRRA